MSVQVLSGQEAEAFAGLASGKSPRRVSCEGFPERNEDFPACCAQRYSKKPFRLFPAGIGERRSGKGKEERERGKATAHSIRASARRASGGEASSSAGTGCQQNGKSEKVERRPGPFERNPLPVRTGSSLSFPVPAAVQGREQSSDDYGKRVVLQGFLPGIPGEVVQEGPCEEAAAGKDPAFDDFGRPRESVACGRSARQGVALEPGGTENPGQGGFAQADEAQGPEIKEEKKEVEEPERSGGPA